MTRARVGLARLGRVAALIKPARRGHVKPEDVYPSQFAVTRCERKRTSVSFAAALIPVSLGPALTGLAGPVYFVVALVLGIAFLALALRFSRDLHRRTARQLFLGSLVYLPLIWLFMIATRVP